MMASLVMLTVKKKLIDNFHYMTPEEVARMKGLDNSTINNSGIDLKIFNNILSVKGKRREVERRDKREENKKLLKKSFKNSGSKITKEINRTW